MKIKLFIGLASLWIICSCNDSFNRTDDDQYPFYHYSLYLNIQDAVGNDRIKGLGYEHDDEFILTEGNGAIKVKSELYTLDIIFPERYMNVYDKTNAQYGSPMNPPSLRICIINGEYYLLFDIASKRFVNIWDDGKSGTYPPADKLICNMTCSYVFGDDETHEIVTLWKPNLNIKYKNMPHPNDCYRIESNNKEFTHIMYADKMFPFGFVSIASITLDNTFNN